MYANKTRFSQLCNAYAQLGARGTSILFASGDGGVAGSQTTTCSKSFLPTFPSGCPFMTSVGATTRTSPEIGVAFSSGGFSNYFARPECDCHLIVPRTKTDVCTVISPTRYPHS